MAAPAKNSEKSQTTRAHILEAAREIAWERGYDGTTLAMIQKRAKVHPGSFYWFFEDKDAMFAALVEHANDEAMAAYDAFDPRGDANPVADALTRIADNPARLGLWRFNVRLMLDPDMQTSRTAEAIRKLRTQTQESMIRRWVNLLEPAVVETFPLLPQQLAEYALVTVEGCILSRVAGRKADESHITALAAQVLDNMVMNAYQQCALPIPVGLQTQLQAP